LKQISTIVSFLALVAVLGCRSHSAAPASRLDYSREVAAIEARAVMVFTNAVLIKPREDLPATELAFKLAPLLIQEIAGPESRSNNHPGTIYYQMGVIQRAGMNYLQMTYLWSLGDGTALTHGVRLTLDSQGLPVIWEILSDPPGPRVVFISSSLEEKAKATFGLPAAGRSFAAEQPRSVSPDVVVARVIEDGPVAMGPIVHQTANHEISAVICRCMPTQARQLAATEYYELKPLSEAVTSKFQRLEPVRNLNETLRLPPAF
jgi:hypothetical protein